MARNGSGTYSLAAGNPVTTNTTISSTWANNTLTDIGTALTQSLSQDGQTPVTANLPMTGFKHTSVAVASTLTDYARADQVQNSSMNYLTAVAGTDTITATLANPTLAAYAEGQTFRLKSAGANLTTAVTLNINSLGAKSITKNGATALAIGDIPSVAEIVVIYDGTQFQLVSPVTVGTAAVTALSLASSAYGNGDIKNVGFTVTMAANAVTIALKTQAAADPSATDPAEITFRNSTLTSGAWTKRAITAALSGVIASSATLGTVSNQPSRIMVLAIDNAGTVELAWCNYNGSVILDEATLISTTTAGAGSTSANVIYSTTARSSVPFRILGYFESTQVTAGTWAANATVLQGNTGSALKSIQGVLGAPTPTTSGTSIDYTGIPSWVRRVTLMFNGVSTNGTSNPLVQIGDAGGIETSGYLGGCCVNGVSANFTTGFGISGASAANVLHGSVVITLLDPANAIWTANYTLSTSNAGAVFNGSGSKSLSPGPLDRVRLTTVNGTDAFDAGSVNILYE